MATKKSTKKNTRKRGRRYMKKAARRTIAALLMITALIVAAIPATPGRASGTEDTPIFKDDDNYHRYFFEINDSGDSLKLVGVKNIDERATGIFNIPEKAGATASGEGTDLPVVSIGVGAFQSNDSVSQANLPGSVTLINQSAFQDCSNLKSVNGSNVTVIEQSAFQGCGSLGLSTVRFSSNLKKIGESAFRDCKSLSTIPADNVEEYGAYAFCGSGLSNSLQVKGPSSGSVEIQDYTFASTSINSVSFADTVVGIRGNAFDSCHQLGTITLPKKINNLDGSAFSNCDGITSFIEIPGSLPQLNAGTFAASTGIPYVKLNNSGTTGNNDIVIIDGAFNESVKNPASTFYVEGYRRNQNNPENPTKAFDYCLRNKIKYKSPDDEWTTNAFTVRGSDGYIVDFDASVYGSSGVFIPKTVSRNSSEDVITVKGITKDAFSRDKASGLIDSIVVPDTIETVEDYAFNIAGLTYVQFQSKKTNLSSDGHVFPDDLLAPDFFVVGIAENDSEPYLYCMGTQPKDFKGYANINGEQSAPYVVVDSDSPYVLYGVASDTTPGTIRTNKPGIAEILLPSGIHEINNTLFQSDDVLRKIKMNGIVKLNDYEFRGCTSLNDVDINSTDLKTIGKLPFFRTSLTSVSINNSNPYCCSDKEKGIIYAPVSSSDSSLTIVEALENNTSTAYTIPLTVRVYDKDVKVTKINEAAFSNNKNLQIFSTEGSEVEEIPASCFVSANSIIEITLGENVGKVGDRAFQKIKSHSSTNETPLFKVYNKFIQYGEKRSKFDYNTNMNEQPYYFRSTVKGDMTYKLCTDDDPTDMKDNLIYLGTIDEDKRISLSECSVHINNKTKKYDGTNAVTWTAGTSDDGDVCDFYVDYEVDSGTKRTLTPGTDYVLGSIDSSLLKPSITPQTVPFYITAVEGSKNYYGSKAGMTFRIVGENDPSGSEFGDYYSIRYVKGQTRNATGSQIQWDASSVSNNGDFYVQKNGSSGGNDILNPNNAKDYSWKWDNNTPPVNPGGPYYFTVTPSTNLGYTGTISGSVTINGGSNSLSSCEIQYPKGQTRKYTGNAISWTPDTDFVVLDNGNPLVYDKHYTMDPIGEVKDLGDYGFTLRGKGEYSGGKLGSFSVIPRGTEDSSVSVNLILNGPDRSAVSVETRKATNTFQYWNEGDPGVIVTTKNGNTLTEKKDYVIEGYKSVKPGLGKNTGYVTINFKGDYADEPSQSVFYDVKKDLSKNTSDDGTKSVTIQVTEATIDSNDKIEATITLTDSTTGTDLVKDTDYLQGSFKKTSDHHADVKITGKGDKYVGTYTYNFHMDEKKSSSSSGKSSSSSSKSSSGSSSAKGSSSSSGTGGSSSTGGSGNRNSGTTVVNRNYYGNNGGTADELEDMLRAAHIDSINGGTADGYQVNITKSDEAERSFREALIRRYGSLDNIRYFSMDIDVKDENGNDIDTTGMSVTLTLPLPRSMEQYGTNNKIATVDSNGDLEDLNEQFSTLEGRPCVTFVAPHFSPYGFYVNTADLAVGTLDNTPKTGDPIHPKWFLSFGLAALSIFLFLKRDPKSRVKPA